MEVLLTSIGAVASIVVAIIGAIALVKQAKVKVETDAETERVNKRAEQRRRESLLCMRMMEANTDLTICMALLKYPFPAADQSAVMYLPAALLPMFARFDPRFCGQIP